MTFYSDFTEAQKINLENKYTDRLDNVIFVHCSHIKGVHMYYKCPFCFDVNGRTKYNPLKRNGEIYKSLKPHLHCHGSGFDVSNRTEGRITHCCSKYHTDDIFGSHKDLELKMVRNKITKEQFDFIKEKRINFLKEQDKEVIMVVDDNTIKNH